jgi:hypothetical protein
MSGGSQDLKFLCGSVGKAAIIPGKLGYVASSLQTELSFINSSHTLGRGSFSLRWSDPTVIF